MESYRTINQQQKYLMKTLHSHSRSSTIVAGLLLWASLSNTEAQTNAGLSLQMYAGLSITGAVGQMYQVQYTDELSDSATWYALTHFPLKWNPHRWVDTTTPANGRRFYRAVAVDVPTNVIPVTNMVFIPPGTFTMGSPVTEAGRWDDEGPQTLVTISRGFWMGRYEVTQGEYLELMGINPSHFNGVVNGTNYGIDLTRPVEQVRWTNAVPYCEALTAREQAAGRLPAGYAYRLPTEAEWEYACRAGTTTPFYLGNTLRSGMANFDGRIEYPPCGDSPDSCTNAFGIYLARTVSVGSYAPNPWGLYDMIGNVSEWCQDQYAVYSGVPMVDPRGIAASGPHNVRGSSWLHPAFFLRSAYRDYAYQANRGGFRIVLAAIP